MRCTTPHTSAFSYILVHHRLCLPARIVFTSVLLADKDSRVIGLSHCPIICTSKSLSFPHHTRSSGQLGAMYRIIKKRNSGVGEILLIPMPPPHTPTSDCDPTIFPTLPKPFPPRFRVTLTHRGSSVRLSHPLWGLLRILPTCLACVECRFLSSLARLNDLLVGTYAQVWLRGTSCEGSRVLALETVDGKRGEVEGGRGGGGGEEEILD